LGAIVLSIFQWKNTNFCCFVFWHVVLQKEVSPMIEKHLNFQHLEQLLTIGKIT